MVEVVVEHLALPGGGDGELREAALAGHEVDRLGRAAGRVSGLQQVRGVLKTVVNCAPTTWNELSPEGPASSTHRRTCCPGGDMQRGVQVLVVVGVEHHGVRLPA